MPAWDILWTHSTIWTGEPGTSALHDAAIGILNGQIVWIGPMQDLPDPPYATTLINANGNLITPGLIDCHTHLVYAGNRADEFEMRLKGASYEEISRQGGGIQSTVKATRAATEGELFEQSVLRAETLMQNGITTLEIKSGYGLDLLTEIKILRVIQKIADALPITVKKTFLGAHVVPSDFKDGAEAYTQYVCNTMIPAIAEDHLADSVDVFCEHIAFTPSQTEAVFKAAKAHGLKIKCHGEQLSCSESAQLAAKYGALSVDHLEYVSADGIKAMAEANTTAVLLPAAFYFLREKQLPPIDMMRKHSVSMALASDCNPGTSPTLSLLPVLNMACVLFRMTPEEALRGVTLNAAKALGLSASYGSLTPGKMADIAVWNARSIAELCYYIGGNPLAGLYSKGKLIV